MYMDSSLPPSPTPEKKCKIYFHRFPNRTAVATYRTPIAEASTPASATEGRPTTVTTGLVEAELVGCAVADLTV